MRFADEPVFILHRRQYSESSLLLEVLTRAHGRISVLARGARGARSGQSAILQPFQFLRMDVQGQGELLRLTRVEAEGPALPLAGERAMAGLYFNELLVRLLPRGLAHPELLMRYARALSAIAQAPDLAWQVRAFERDLLAELGLDHSWQQDLAGRPLDPQTRYALDPTRGFFPCASGETWSGETLLALGAELDSAPSAVVQGEARRLLRRLLEAELDGGSLQSWAMVASLPRPGAE